MRLRTFPIAVLLLALLPPAEGLAARKKNGGAPPAGKAANAAAAARRQAFWACSDGKGSVQLFWLPAQGEWPPGGFRLERVDRGRPSIVAADIRPGGDALAMTALSDDDAAAIRELSGRIEAGTLTDEERRASISVMGRNAAVDPAYGRALGVRYTDGRGAPGKRKYRLVFLDSLGLEATALESSEVDPARRTPGPEKPAGLSAEPRGDGVALRWADPPASAVAPVVAYLVERAGPGRETSTLTEKPLVLNRHLAPDGPQFLDADVVPGAATYQVRSQDIFGRRSVPAQVKVVAADFPAAEPPPLRRTAAVNLRPDSATDAAPAARVPIRPATDAAPEARETIPSATDSASATRATIPSAPPPAPEPPKPAPDPAASPAAPVSPIIARGATGSDDGSGAEIWARLAAGRGELVARRTVPAQAAPAPSTSSPGEAEAEGYPPSPAITDVVAAGGKVSIAFRPGAPEERTAEFVVLRSESPAGEGAPVGRPVPGDARRWEDGTVAAGRNYWYRLVAVGKDGKRSEPAGPRWIRVGD